MGWERVEFVGCRSASEKQWHSPLEICICYPGDVYRLEAKEAVCGYYLPINSTRAWLRVSVWGCR